jgi:hypothetical protein
MIQEEKAVRRGVFGRRPGALGSVGGRMHQANVLVTVDEATCHVQVSHGQLNLQRLI